MDRWLERDRERSELDGEREDDDTERLRVGLTERAGTGDSTWVEWRSVGPSIAGSIGAGVSEWIRHILIDFNTCSRTVSRASSGLRLCWMSIMDLNILNRISGSSVAKMRPTDVGNVEINHQMCASTNLGNSASSQPASWYAWKMSRLFSRIAWWLFNNFLAALIGILSRIVRSTIGHQCNYCSRIE